MSNFPTGDKGQRFEVRFFDRETGRECMMGWTNSADGEPLMGSVKLLPTARDPFVVDRFARSGPAEGVTIDGNNKPRR